MTWMATGQWFCDDCQQVANEPGEQCGVHELVNHRPCRPVTKRRLEDADARGDGALVNALCAYGRALWRMDRDW